MSEHVSALRIALLAFMATMGLLATGCKQSMVTRAEKAAGVLRDFAASGDPLPRDVLAKAEAIAVLRESETSAVIGAGGGQGVMVQRTPKGWSAPIALDTTVASLGVQVGTTSRDVVLVFRSIAEVDRVVNEGAYSLAEAAATFGPSRAAAADTDNPVLIFERVSGLYAGARVGGVGFTVNTQVNRETYGMAYSTADILRGKVERPYGTFEFFRLLPEAAPRPVAN